MADQVYMLVRQRQGRQVEYWYGPPATNKKDAWDNAMYWWQFCGGGVPTWGWKERMKADGWRAAKVEIQAMYRGGKLI